VPFEAGATLGPYELIDLIGRGGMGEVYRARDTRLGRLVAIKVITPALADRADVRRRFEVECRLSATLDHPRICAVHDVGGDGSALYLVMEFLEGESLAQRLRRGPLPIHELLGMAIEIASAVSHAHQRGVIHRDLKPANVFVTPAGVKVLDFGLAKLRQPDAAAVPEMAGLDTAPVPPTAVGSVLGTAQYLPPERLEGKPADHRSDIFGFGTILYEMATGRQAFDAATPAALVAAILTSEPPPLEGASPVVADLDWVVRRCLAKNPEDRWQSLADVEAVLRRLARTSGTALPALQSPPTRARVLWRRIAATAALLAAVSVLAVGAAAVLNSRAKTGTSADLVALTIPPPAGGAFTATQASVDTAQFALSPDGRILAFAASGEDGVSRLWTRPRDSTVPTPIEGTEDASYPFWSPDGRSLGFFAGHELRRIDLGGGPARRLGAAPNGRGGTWSSSGVIVFAPIAYGTLLRVAADGSGAPEPLTAKDSKRGDLWHRWPEFLPDGRTLLFSVSTSKPEQTGIYLASLDAPQPEILMQSPASGHYGPDEHLLYVADGTLLARKLDVGRRRLEGDPVVVAKGVGTASNAYAAVSSSPAGVIAYSGNRSASELVWFDRTGRRIGEPAAARASYVDFDIAPGGTSLAVAMVDREADRADIRVLDLTRPGTGHRVTSVRANDASPIWSPDGRRIVFRSNREGSHDLYMRSASGGGDDEVVFIHTSAAKYPTNWSARGGVVVYHTEDDRTRWDIWGAPASSPNEQVPLVRTGFTEVQGQISPDEQWLAYTSDRDSGRPEIYVQQLGGAGRWQVSVGGATDPKWRADGRELFYVASNGRLTAVAFASGRGRPEFGQPQRLFQIGNAEIAPPYLTVYEPVPSGDTFLVNLLIQDVRTLPLTVLVNWRRQ
jgi:Tol biopolymer transport system component